MTERIELRHLRYFLAVAEELHFGRAARRLGISQPPLSLQIRQLESELGVQLFERTKRRVALTDGGRALLAEGKRLLSEFTNVAELVRRAAIGESGSLTVAFTASVMFETLPAIIRGFRARFPHVHVELREIGTGAQLVALRTGDLDIGFVRQPPPDHQLQFETVMTERLVLALSRTHPFAKRQTVKLRDVANEDWVLPPHDHTPGFHAQLMALCHEAGISPRVVQVSRELYTTVSLVDAGIGVTILPATMTTMGWKGVRYYPLQSKLGVTRIAAAWRRDNVNPTLTGFLDIARSVVASVPQ
jgi:LysR family transcriptional regulator, benzoate and cis,cis-muconate-responsive activator of ben and cat genes